MGEEKKSKLSVLNVDEGTARAVCYIPVLGVVGAVVFLVLEKNKQVKWDAVQALVLWVLTLAAGWVINISYVLRILYPLVNVTGMVIIPLVLALKASQKQETRLPYLSEITDKLVK